MDQPKELRVNVVELSRAQLYRLAGLEPSAEHLLEEQFVDLLGREPDESDRSLGLERIVLVARGLTA